jgi:hypothetical protein
MQRLSKSRVTSSKQIRDKTETQAGDAAELSRSYAARHAPTHQLHG